MRDGCYPAGPVSRGTNSAFPEASRSWRSSASRAAQPGRRTGVQWFWIGSTRGSTQRHPFHNHVRVISGASGGMVGTAYYVKWLYDGRPGSDPRKRRVWPSGPERWYTGMPINSLRKVARSLALRETWRMFVPRWWDEFDDRGIVLEQDWVDLRQISFSDLRPVEDLGEIPSLIFSPMTVDDGRRLLISNLDLRTDAGTPAAPTPAHCRSTAGLHSMAKTTARRQSRIRSRRSSSSRSSRTRTGSCCRPLRG